MQPTQISAAFALFRSAGGDWLVQWNRHWQAFNVIGGRVEPGESFYECAVREVQEELGLSEGDFSLLPEPIANIEFSGRSNPSDIETRYCMQLFQADAGQASPIELLAAAPQNRLLALAEVAAGLTHDGHHISEVTQRFAAALRDENPG